MSKKCIRLCLTMLLAMALTLTGFASSAKAEVVDMSKTGSISFSFSGTDQNGNIVHPTDGEISLYHVADIDWDGSAYVYQPREAYEGFKETGVAGCNLDDLEADNLSHNIYAYILQNEVEADYVQTIDENGKVSFGDLPLGLYLVVQSKESNKFYPMESFLITVPQADENGHYIYDVASLPKTEVEMVPSMEMPPRPTQPDESTSPEPTQPSESQPVEPDTPAESTPPESTQPGTTVPATTTPGTTATTPPPTLPVTGQLNWPIPVLAISGILFFSLGWMMKNRREEETE